MLRQIIMCGIVCVTSHSKSHSVWLKVPCGCYYGYTKLTFQMVCAVASLLDVIIKIAMEITNN